MPLLPEDLTLINREILPINQGKFGVVITEEEAIGLARDGYKVIELPVKSRRRQGDEIQRHIEVYITALDREAKTFDKSLAMAETCGYADVVIYPYPWTVGERSGVKAYVKVLMPLPPGAYPDENSKELEIKQMLANMKCVQAGWAFGVPEDGRDLWLDLVVKAVMEKYS